MVLAVVQQSAGVCQAIASAAGPFGLVAITTERFLGLRFRPSRNDQVVVRRTVLAAHQAGVVAALAGPVRAKRRDAVGCGR
ncbi:hypothetical protein D3C84_1154710 [compost metagenome]